MQASDLVYMLNNFAVLLGSDDSQLFVEGEEFLIDLQHEMLSSAVQGYLMASKTSKALEETLMNRS